MRQRFKVNDVHAPESPSSQAVPVYFAPVPDQEDVEPVGSGVPLTHYLWILKRHLWKIVAFVAACVLITFIVSARLKPIYESTATIDVDLQAPTQVVGENGAQSYAQVDADQFLATQIKLIQSDAVLRPVAEQFHLLGQDSHSQSVDLAKAQQALSAPVSLGQLSIVRPPSTYLLQISYRSQNAGLAAEVANAVASSYLTYTYNLRIRSSLGLSDFMAKQLDELKAKMEQSSMALAQYQKDLDVINPDEKTNILSARLLQLNTEYTNAEADRIRAEAAWNALKSGSLDAAQAALGTGATPQPAQGNSLTDLTNALNDAKQRFALAKSTYGSNHPEYRKAASQLAEVQREFNNTRQENIDSVEAQVRESQSREEMLRDAVATTKAEWDNINVKSFQYQRLKQEADTDKALYDELIKKIREGDINSGFRNNNIRIADFARPSPLPVYPNKRRNVELAFVFSLLLAVGTAILLDSLDNTLRDPKQASRFLGTDVIASMPSDRDAAQLPHPAKSASTPFVVSSSGEGESHGGYYRTASSFEEAIRTLRNTILLSDMEGLLHSIVLTSAMPGEGKTTITAHLGIANADRGKRTLLVDGDLRRPSLSSKFGLTPREGLSNVLNGEMRWQDVVLPIKDKPNLCLLPAGVGSHRASDLIGPRISTLLDEFAKEYDLVILDAPPLLGFAECLQMAAAADGVLVTTIAGKTRRGTVADVIGALRRVHANVIGVVLNQVNRGTFSEGYSYYGQYNYSSYRDISEPNIDSQS